MAKHRAHHGFRRLAGAMTCALLLASPAARAQNAPQDGAKDGAHTASGEPVGDMKNTGSNWVRGNVKAMRATAAGLLLAFEKNRVPANCESAQSYLLLIPQANTAMTDLFLATWAKGQRRYELTALTYAGTAPTNPYVDRGANYCTASGIQPR